MDEVLFEPALRGFRLAANVVAVFAFWKIACYFGRPIGASMITRQNMDHFKERMTREEETESLRYQQQVLSGILASVAFFILLISELISAESKLGQTGSTWSFELGERALLRANVQSLVATLSLSAVLKLIGIGNE